MWKAVMPERLRERDERHARIKAEKKEREWRYAKEIEMFEQSMLQSKMEWLQSRIGYKGLFVVEPIGRSGGFSLLWKEKEKDTLNSYTKNHIDLRVCVENMQKWMLTGFYGELNRSQQRRNWDLLRNISRDANLPWYVIGDLNNVIALEDKQGDVAYPNWLIEGFNQVLTTIFLEPTLTVHRSVKKSLCFENAWLYEPICAQIIKGRTGYHELDILEKIHIYGERLGEWGKEITGKFGNRLKLCKNELKQLRGKRDNASVERFKKELISDYFRQLYMTDEPDWDEVITNIPSTITKSRNGECLKPILNDEVKSVLFQMHPDKAPGPGGMTPAFFQKHWCVVENDMVKVVRKFFSDGTGL
ncbi:uncharacterized protein LOC141665756 [Apium graveolens]|uniref:uncharacterized protein LOC141665756 n=1 Tax=Apium graveolens TaxID=4045 RepID=UPI003D799194